MQLDIFCLVNHAIQRNEPENRAIHREMETDHIATPPLKKSYSEIKMRKVEVGTVHPLVSHWSS